MLSDELEFSISQYVDGTLDSVAARAVEEMFASDPLARDTFHSFERLNVLLVEASPLPAMDWDEVHARISSSLDASIASEDDAKRARFKLSNYTRWVGSAVAVAAAVLVIVSVQLKHPSTSISQHAKSSNSINIAIGPGSDGGAVAIGDASANATVAIADPSITNHPTSTAVVAIGPSAEVASSNKYFGDETDGQSGRVVIAGDVGAAPSGDPSVAPF